MKPILNKIFIALAIILGISTLSIIIYYQIEHKKQLDQIQSQITSQQQLIDGITRSKDSYASSADLQKFAADNNINLQAIQDNLKTLNSQLSSINVVSSNSTAQVSNNLPSSGIGITNPNSTITVPCSGKIATCPDPYGYQKNQQNFNLNEDFGNLKVPFGTIGFSAWQKDPWNTNIPERQYNVATVIGTDPNGKQTYYNKFTVKVNSKDYEIPIKTATTEQQLPKASFSWFNPRLLLGASGNYNFTHFHGDFTPSINFGIMSYGQFKTTPDLSILEIGFGYEVVNKSGAIIITPIAYNFGKNLFSPLMNNTYIAPDFMIGTDGSLAASLGIRVGF